jgi:hypothetical protein
MRLVDLDNADEHPPAGQNIAEKLVSCTRLLI